jgi:perosamine synthetase
MDISAFHRLSPVPEEGIESAVELMRNGGMFRYASEDPETSAAAILEREFAIFTGVKFALGLNSCSSAILLALKVSGVKSGDRVLVPAFTFTAVPAAVVNLGATPVLVECNGNYKVNVDDLRRKITSDTRVLLLSHMRGHMSDMDRIVDICNERGVTLIEDAAHAIGVLWRGKPAGSFGRIGCFSFQSYKVVDSGEGGMLTTCDEELAVKAIYLSGAYEKLYSRHFMQSGLFEKYMNLEAPYGFRMTNLTAAIVRSQLKEVETRGETYRRMYGYLCSRFSACAGIELPAEDQRERRIPDSIQFRLRGFSALQMRRFGEFVKEAGLPVSLPGLDADNARSFRNWLYLGNIPDLPETRAALESTCDMRLARSLTTEHLDYIADTVIAAIDRSAQPICVAGALR